MSDSQEENQIDQAIFTLNFFPDRYDLFECELKHILGIHKMAVDNYFVCYVIDSGVMTITDVSNKISNVHKRLQERYVILIA